VGASRLAGHPIRYGGSELQAQQLSSCQACPEG
jgi:hypothetical protein